MIVTALTKLDGFTKHNQIPARDFPRELADILKPVFEKIAKVEASRAGILIMLRKSVSDSGHPR